MEVGDGGNDQESVTPAVIATGESRFMQIGEPQRTIVVEPLKSPVGDPESQPEPTPTSTPEAQPEEVPVAL